MDRRFSIATLLLLTTIAAISLASMRMAIVRLWTANGNDLLSHMGVGAFAGMGFGVGLAVWNRTRFSQPFLNGAGGLILGAAAGAQMGLEAPWAAVFTAPVALVAMAALVGFNRRRQLAVAESAATLAEEPIHAATGSTPVVR